MDVCGTGKIPSLKWNCQKDKRYTIILLDQYGFGAASSKVLLSPYTKWAVVDIPGCNVEKGTAITEYQRPFPDYGTGDHTYPVLVYEQPDYDIDWSDEPLVSQT